MLQVASCLLALAAIVQAVPADTLVGLQALSRRNSSDDGFYPPQCKSFCERASIDNCDNVPAAKWHACHCAPAVGTNLGNCESCLVAHNWFNVTSAQTLVDQYNKVCGTSVTVDPSHFMNSTTGGSGGSSGAPTSSSSGSTTGGTSGGPSSASGGPSGTSTSGSPGTSTGSSAGGSPTTSPPGGQSPFGNGGGATGLKAAAGLAIGLASAATVGLLVF